MGAGPRPDRVEGRVVDPGLRVRESVDDPELGLRVARVDGGAVQGVGVLQREVVVDRAVDDEQRGPAQLRDRGNRLDRRRIRPANVAHPHPAPTQYPTAGAILDEMVDDTHDARALVIPERRRAHAHHCVDWLLGERGLAQHDRAAHRESDRGNPPIAELACPRDRGGDVEDLFMAHGRPTPRPPVPAHIKGHHPAEPREPLEDPPHLRGSPAVREPVDDDERELTGVGAVAGPVDGADLDAIGRAQHALDFDGHGSILAAGRLGPAISPAPKEDPMRLILLTRAMEPSAEVLPALGLLAHQVRTLPAEPTALLDAPGCDALLVDGRRDLPAVRGLTRLLRQTGVDVPIILITTEGGLAAIQWDWGMDEVLIDTTSPAELEARLRLAVARVDQALGTGAGQTEEIRSGELMIDESTYTAKLRGRVLDLTFKEFELLKFLAQHPGRVFTRAVLLQEVWGYDYFGGTRTVDVHVRRLRAKLGAEHESLIGTVRNVGYRFVPQRVDDATLAVVDDAVSEPLPNRA